MNRYLVLERAVSDFSTLEVEISEATKGQIAVSHFDNPKMRALLNRSGAERQSGSVLIEADEQQVQLYTGNELRIRLFSILGPRRAWHVAQAIGGDHFAGVVDSASRRRFLQRVAAVAAGFSGVALLGPVPRVVRAGDVISEGIRRPGKYSRQEGIQTWDVKETADGYRVEFEHEKPRLSGKVTITFGGNGRSTDVVLNRNGERLTTATSRGAGTFAAVDSDGRAMAAEWNQNRREWSMTDQSRRFIDDNSRDLKIAHAVVSDLWPSSFGSRSAVADANSIGASTVAAQQKCSERDRRWGRSGVLPINRSLGCEGATDEVHQLCNEVSNCKTGCCDLLPCDCGCLFGDFTCWCEIAGDPPAADC